jgi:hypothetical protein
MCYVAVRERSGETKRLARGLKRPLSQRFGDRIQAIPGGEIECLAELEDGGEETLAVFIKSQKRSVASRWFICDLCARVFSGE